MTCKPIILWTLNKQEKFFLTIRVSSVYHGMESGSNISALNNNEIERFETLNGFKFRIKSWVPERICKVSFYECGFYICIKSSFQWREIIISRLSYFCHNSFLILAFQNYFLYWCSILFVHDIAVMCYYWLQNLV